jgi:predicted Zn finger-like uncharacterized protein
MSGTSDRPAPVRAALIRNPSKPSTAPPWAVTGMVSNSLTDRPLGSQSGDARSSIRPMLIVCPSCATSYEVSPASLPPEGRQVRCSRCLTVWRAEPNHADKLLAAAAAIGPEAQGARETTGLAAQNTLPARVVQGAEPDAWMQTPDERPADDRSVAASSGEVAADAHVEAPPLAPADVDDGHPSVDVGAHDAADERPPPQDIESVAARHRPQREAKHVSRWPLSLLQTGILALFLVDTIIVGWRSDIVRILPQTASFYALFRLPVNLRGLTFDGIVTGTEQHEGVPILVVEGNMVNNTNKMVDVPRLKFIVRNAARQEIYSWTAVPSRSSLPPGEAVGFRTRLASPPPEARDVIVRFMTRRDVVAGAR